VKSLLLGLWQRLRGTPGSRLHAAAAVAIGLFIGTQPLYGLHLVLVLAVCVPLRLDAVLSYLAANISNPILAPLLIVSEVQVGSYLLLGRFVSFDLEAARATGAAGFAQQLFCGALVVGTALALIGFALTWMLVPSHSGPRDVELREAMDRTRRRYTNGPRADRYYVASKLALDPVFTLLRDEPGAYGKVVDLGCGRGQLGVLLLELGRAESLFGVDSDVRKISVARRAAPEAIFQSGDLATFPIPRADTILLIDVLHYLPLGEQDELLARAATALLPGGRLLVRELDHQASRRSRFTRAAEWIARRVGLNRGRATHYRSAEDVRHTLERMGLTCQVRDASSGTPFGNVLIVAGAPTTNVDDALSASSTRTSPLNA